MSFRFQGITLCWLIGCCPLGAWASTNLTTPSLPVFLRHYHLQPDPKQLLPALDAYLAAAASSPTAMARTPREEDFILQSAQARFFAVLSISQPEILSHAQKRFPGSDASQKSALLAIFERARAESLRVQLLAWSRTEDDDELRLRLEQAARPGPLPLDIVEHPARDLATLEEQWACFFALGNTAVVRASLQIWSDPNFASGRRSLREEAWNDLIRRSWEYEAVRAALISEAAGSGAGEVRERLLDLLAAQVVEAEDVGNARRLAPVLENQWSGRAEARQYFQGCMAVLEERGEDAARCLQTLSASHALLAERLRGYAAWIAWERQRRQAIGSQASTPAPEVLQRFQAALTGLKSWRAYETAQTPNPFDQERSGRFAHQMAQAVAGLQTILCWRSEAGGEFAWEMDPERTFFWNERSNRWAEMNSQPLRAKIEVYTSLQPLQGSISADKITGFRQLQTPQGVIAEITLGVEDLGSWVGYDFTGATEQVCAAQIRLYFEPLTGRWLCLEATWKPAEATSESSAALGRLTRVVFDQNDASLQTLADSLQAGRALLTPTTEKK